jgi:hypothetical protein
MRNIMAYRKKKPTEWIGKVKGGRGFMGAITIPKAISPLILNMAKITANYWEDPQAQLYYLNSLLRDIPQEIIEAVERSNVEE